MPTLKTDSHDRLLERVRNLLAMAASANEYEAATAAAKASELLMRHHLDMAEVEGYEPPTLDEIIRSGRISFSTMKVPQWKIMLINYLAIHNNCKMITLHARSGFAGYDAAFELVGRGESILVTKYQYEYMVNTLGQLMDTAWRVYLSTTGKYVRDNKKTYSTSFYVGAVMVLGRRLAELRKAEKSQESSMALIVLESKLAEQKFQSLYPHVIHQSTRLSTNSISGYQAGREAGGRLSIHTGVGTSGGGARLLPSAK